MFQLIVAVISIALVAALAIASIFYGGEAFSKSSEKANVTALVNAGQQISGAYTLYKTDYSTSSVLIGTSADTTSLVGLKYLASAPSGSRITSGDWSITDTGAAADGWVAQIALAGDTTAICREVERQAGGKDVSGTWTPNAAAQFKCDGTNFRFKL